MEQRINFITLGVKDLGVMRSFYTEKFGWKLMNEQEGIAFFKLNGIVLSLYPQHELMEDITINEIPSAYKNITMAICFNSEKEVDDAVKALRAKGVKIIKDPQKVFWGGYSGYIEDAENNYWELAYNPFIKFDETGSISSMG